MTHTPGPWMIEKDAAYAVSEDCTGVLIYSKSLEEPIIAEMSNDCQNVEADARLIAAAPALLEACQICDCVLNGDDHSWNAAKEAVAAAIALAKGEQ